MSRPTREQIIEAAAKAEYEREYSYLGGNGVGLPPWSEAGPNARSYELEMAGRYLDAMERLIRQACAGEIADAIRAQDSRGYAMYEWAWGEAADLAVEIGAAP